MLMGQAIFDLLAISVAKDTAQYEVCMRWKGFQERYLLQALKQSASLLYEG